MASEPNNRHLKPIVLIALTALSLVVIGHSLFSATPPPHEMLTTPSIAPGAHGPELQGVASCASAACHHGNGPKGAWRSEYTTWISYDPHANAYEVLYDEKSVQIIHNLNEQ